MGKKSYAFTLIEILVVLVIIATLVTITTTRLFRRKPSIRWPVVLDEFNNVINFARQEAIMGKKNYRLFFKSNKQQPDFVVVQREEDDPENPDKKVYKQVHSQYFEKTKYVLPEEIKMVGFYKKSRENIFDENKGNAYCYIIPNGLVQDCIIHLVKKVDEFEDKATLKVQPFFGFFEYHEGFVKSVHFENE